MQKLPRREQKQHAYPCEFETQETFVLDQADFIVAVSASGANRLIELSTPHAFWSFAYSVNRACLDVCHGTSFFGF
jgi:hypothetical protein